MRLVLKFIKHAIQFFCLVTLLVLMSSCSHLQNPQTKYDIVIRNGWVLDGFGKSAVKADVAINDGRFVKIGKVIGNGIRELDVSGKHISPGWIDMMDQSGHTLLKNGRAENKVLMGVTSVIGGEGGTPVAAGKIHDYFQTLEQQGISVNFGSYYNVWQARSAVVGRDTKTVTKADIENMKSHMVLAMEEGVMGMSSATFYAPQSLVTTYELVEMAKAIAPYGGIYAAHMRDESEKLLTAIEEMVTVGEQANIPVEIFHFKNAFAPHWHIETPRAISLINKARKKGIDIAADQYPYTAAGTGIDATVPSWVFEEGLDEAIKKLSDKNIRAQLKREIADPHSNRMVNNSGGWENVVLANAYNDKYTAYHGKNFEEIGRVFGKDPADAAWDIMLEAMPNRAFAFYHMMSESDVKTIIKQPWVSIGSDSAVVEMLDETDDIGLPHPRAYGTFPRIIAKYVREEGTLTLEEAIRKMTSLPAKRMKLQDRGSIRKNNWADVVIFDYKNIQDMATWEAPFNTPEGIDYVLVNGEIVVERGAHTGKTPGKVLYGKGYKKGLQQ